MNFSPYGILSVRTSAVMIKLKDLRCNQASQNNFFHQYIDLIHPGTSYKTEDIPKSELKNDVVFILFSVALPSVIAGCASYCFPLPDFVVNAREFFPSC